MRADLNQAFLDELARQGRGPRQLLVFKFTAGDIFVSDQTYTGLPDIYLPIVESWGDLENINSSSTEFNADASATLQMTISLLNTGPDRFSDNFITENPENIEVDLYQWFDGFDYGDKVLINTFLVQDPIAFSEASGLLSLDLVSKNQYSDPYVGMISTVDHEFYGVVLGSLTGAPGTPYGSHPVVTLAGDIDASVAIITCNEDLAAAGFPASGYVIIDFELIQYTGISGASFTGCTRGSSAGSSWSAAFAHDSGRQIFVYGHEYLFAFGQGPLEFMGPVSVDGVVYTGPHTIYQDRNPVQVGFPNGYPYTRQAGSDLITADVTGNGDLGSYGGYIVSINESEIAFDCDTTGYKCRYNQGMVNGYEIANFYWTIQISDAIKNFTELSSAKLDITAWDKRVHDYLNGGWQLSYQIVYIPGGGARYITDNPPSPVDGTFLKQTTINGYNSWSSFTGAHFFSCRYCSSDTAWNTSDAGGVRCVLAEVKYKPYIKNYSSAVTCDLSSGTGNTNPADAIEAMLGKIGIGAMVDSASFQTAWNWFDTNSYAFAGFIPGDMRCRQAIKDMCRQSRSALVYNAGTIKLIIRQLNKDQTPIATIDKDNLQLRSISVQRQNIADIINYVDVRFDAVDVQKDYQQLYTCSDSSSLSKYGKHDTVWDAYLIKSAAMAQDVAGYYLEVSQTPAMFISCRTYLASFPLELHDTIELQTDFNKFFSVRAQIISSKRIFGSGKNHQINLFEITVKTNDYQLLELLGGADVINATEVVQIELLGGGFGTCGFGERGYGQ